MYVRTCNVCFYWAIFFIVIYFIMVFTWLLLCELFLIVEVALLTVTMSKTNFPLGIIKYLSVCLCNRVTKTGWTFLWTVMTSFSQMFVVLFWLVTVKQLIKDQEGNCNLVINTFIYHLKLNQSFPEETDRYRHGLISRNHDIHHDLICFSCAISCFSIEKDIPTNKRETQPQLQL